MSQRQRLLLLYAINILQIQTQLTAPSPASGRCCPDPTTACCLDGTCVTSSDTCCLTGGACGPGLECCESGCAPDGSQCCIGGGYCPQGQNCVLVDGKKGCCVNLDCSGPAGGSSSSATTPVPPTTAPATPPTTALSLTAHQPPVVKSTYFTITTRTYYVYRYIDIYISVDISLTTHTLSLISSPATISTSVCPSYRLRGR